MDSKPMNLDSNDVISIEQKEVFRGLRKTFKVSQLILLMGEIFNQCGADAKAPFNHEGLACEALVH